MYEYLGNTGILMYDFVGALSAVAFIVFNLLQTKQKVNELSKLTQFLHKKFVRIKVDHYKIGFALVELFIITVFQVGFVAKLNNTFGNIVDTGANYFGLLFFGPIILFVWFYISSLNPFKQMDRITPAYPLALIFVKLACFCQGCCRGMECSWGWYYPNRDATMFPSQFVEAVLALAIFIFLMIYRKKAKEGTLFPIYLIVYSFTRFFAEFFRSEENVLGFLKTYHILCIIGVVIGFLWLFIVCKFSDRINVIYSKAPFPWSKEKKVVYQNKKKTGKTKVKNSALANNQNKKVGHKKCRMWILIWSLGLMGQIGWNVEGVWFNTFVYEKIDKNPSIITPMLIFSALATTVSIFLFGTLSDRTGKRRTFIASGYGVWGILIMLFGLTQFISNRFYLLTVICLVLGDMFVSFFGSVSTDVGFAAWTTDIMNDDNKGKVGAALAVQCVLGSLLGNVIGGYVVGEENNYLRLFIVVGSVLACFGVISAYMFTKKDDIKPSVRGTFKEQLFSVFDFKKVFKQKELLLVHLSVIIFFIGFNTYFPHLGNYLIHYLGFAADKMGIVQAIPLVLGMIVTLPVSNFINKDKFVLVSLVAITSGVLGAMFMFPITPAFVDTTKAFSFSLFMGIFFLGVSYVVMLQTTKIWSKKLYPKDSKGQYEGFWAMSYGLLPMIFGSNISQIIIKTGTSTVVNDLTGQVEYIPDGKIFLVGVIISTLSIVPIGITNIISNKNLKSDIKRKSENQTIR